MNKKDDRFIIFHRDYTKRNLLDNDYKVWMIYIYLPYIATLINFILGGIYKSLFKKKLFSYKSKDEYVCICRYWYLRESKMKLKSQNNFMNRTYS